MRKRLLSIFLVLFMVFTMMPVSALAEEVDNTIGTTYEVSGTDAVPVFANGDIISLTGEWTPLGGTITIPNSVTSLTIKFNRKQLTGNITVEGGGGGMNLTLENANLGGTITFGDRPDNKLNFVGENNVIANFNGAGCIVAGSTKLTIECTNYLTFNSVPNSPAINAPNGYVTISSGNITATRSPGEDYTIIAKVLEIKGSASLRVHSWRDLGVRAMEGVVVQGSSSLDTYSVKGDLTVLGGSATVKGNVDGKLDVKSGGSARITGNLSGEKFVEEGGTAIVGNRAPIGKTPLPTLTVQVGGKLILDADAIAYDPDGDAISIIICDVWDGHGYIECEYDWHTGKKVVKGLEEGSGKIRVVVDDAYGGVAFDIEVPITVTAALPAAYTVTYKPGANGMGSEASETKTHDEALTLKGSIFTREGFTQTGWATSDGGEKAYELGGSYSANADIDLYPVWTINNNKITTTLTFEDSTSTQDCTNTSFHINHTHADGKKCWSWNADNKTLTLDGINLEMSNDSGCGIRLVSNNAVITLTDGSINTVTTRGSAWYPIMTWDDLTINGNGKLIAMNTTGGNNHAISVDDDLIIDGAEVIATHNGCTEAATDARGISARNITIQGNSKVTASGDSGISAYQSLTMKSGMVTGMGLEFCGISANTLTIEGGNVTSNGGPKSDAIWGSTVNILGGTVTATATSGKKPFNQEPTLSGMIHKDGTGTWNNIGGTTCVYEKDATYTLTYTAGANGAISGNTVQTVSHGGNGTIVTATPTPGYHFVSWSDGVLTASRTDKNVMGSISVTANFAADTYTITLNANGGDAITPATLTTGVNGKLTSLPVSTRSGSYSFKGWFTEASGGTAVTTDTVFSADATIYAHWIYTGGSGGGTSTPAPTPSSTIKGEVIYSGEAVNGINAQVTNNNDGSKVISFKSQEAIMEKKVDGTTQAFSNFNKVGFTAAVGTTSSISMSEDGTIQIKDLINGTKSTFNMVFHMGESQKIVIGKINVEVDKDGEISLSSTLIDPYGVIIDASTGEPITGVQVTLYYADTVRNKINGKLANTLVELPILDGFEPSDNKNPQASDEKGFYAFMVYPTSDYYIIATKDGYETYKSMTISVEQEIVRWDFKMNKHLIGTQRLAGESRVDTSLAIAKANYSTKLKNVILASASNYPDALTGSVLAYKLNAPILLVGSTDTEQNKVIDYMKSNLSSTGTVYILGGTGAVALEIENKINKAGFNNITRISGKNRSETALKITDFLEVPIGRPLILVNEGNYADALSVSTSAAAAQSPILLIGKDGLTAEVKQKIAEIKPIKIYLIGGEGAISKKVASQVAEITDLHQENIIRIGGKDRYDTSLAVAKYFGLSGKNACLATGRNFPDALAGSVYAANYNAPVILVDDSITQETKEYLISRKMRSAVIFGGEGVIGKEMEQELLKLLVSE